jgi:hypothetical protein
MLGFGDAMTAHPHVVPPPANAPHAGPRMAVWRWRSVVMPGMPATMEICMREYNKDWTCDFERTFKLTVSASFLDDFCRVQTK